MIIYLLQGTTPLHSWPQCQMIFLQAPRQLPSTILCLFRPCTVLSGGDSTPCAYLLEPMESISPMAAKTHKWSTEFKHSKLSLWLHAVNPLLVVALPIGCHKFRFYHLARLPVNVQLSIARDISTNHRKHMIASRVYHGVWCIYSLQ